MLPQTCYIVDCRRLVMTKHLVLGMLVETPDSKFQSWLFNLSMIGLKTILLTASHSATPNSPCCSLSLPPVFHSLAHQSNNFCWCRRGKRVQMARCGRLHEREWPPACQERLLGPKRQLDLPAWLELQDFKIYRLNLRAEDHLLVSSHPFFMTRKVNEQTSCRWRLREVQNTLWCTSAQGRLLKAHSDKEYINHQSFFKGCWTCCVNWRQKRLCNKHL